MQAGTYFPKSSKFGRPGMMEILKKLNSVWHSDREKIDKTIRSISEVVTPHLDPTGEGSLSDATLEEALSGKPLEEMLSQLDEARERLFAERVKRIHPGKDDKILTSWNGLMIAALAKVHVYWEMNSILMRREKRYSFSSRNCAVKMGAYWLEGETDPLFM